MTAQALYEFIEEAPLDQHSVSERKPGKRTLTYRYRSIKARPALRDGKDALKRQLAVGHHQRS
jgi:hypothetical protein